MYIVWAIAGGIAGAIALRVLEQSLVGVVVGALLGLLWARQNALSQSLDKAHRLLQRTTGASDQSESRGPAEDASGLGEPPNPARDSESEIDLFPTSTWTPDSDAVEPTPFQHQPVPASTAQVAGSSPEFSHGAQDNQASAPAGPDLLKRYGERIWSWFTTGNVPVKVGILVLFAGVAALLKYAYDTEVFTVPLGVRVSAIAVAALAALAFGWFQRERRRTFALSLQGGGIGILLLVIFASLRLYGLLGPLPAFVLLITLVAGTGVLAVLQDSLALAALGLVAGFAAPILASTGHGSHVTLFAYYTVLNLAIFGIAWQKSWRLLNVMGFMATFVIGTAWGVLRYQPEYFASTEPFLILNFLLYLAIPWLYLRNRFDDRKKLIDAGLLFGNPLICLLLQASLLQWQPLPIAASALAMAVIYVFAAWGMRKHTQMGVLYYGWAVLGGVLATLAVPLALDASLTSSVFALEGAAMVWLGLRQHRRFLPWAGLGMQVLAAAPLLAAYWTVLDSWRPPVFNSAFLGAMLIVAAGAASSWCYNRRALHSSWLAAAAIGACLWSLFWWCLATVTEILRVLDGREVLAGLWLLFAVTAWCLAEVARRTAGKAGVGTVTAWAGAGFSALVLPCVLFCFAVAWQPLAGWILAAVLISAAIGWRMLAGLHSYPKAAVLAHSTWWWRWGLVAGTALLLAFDTHSPLSNAWDMLLLLLPIVVLWFVALTRPGWLAPPLADMFPVTRQWLMHSLALVLGIAFLGGLFAEGGADPIAFIPLFNPVDLLLLSIAAGFVVWSVKADLPSELKRIRPAFLGVGGIVLATSVTLRAVHHLANVPWDSALFHSSLAQLSLTVVWSISGVLAWLWGSRKGQYQVWLAGAITMGVVLLKLLLIDRQSLGDLFGIASFLAYGLLCVGLGYFAPVPPRRAQVATMESAVED